MRLHGGLLVLSLLLMAPSLLGETYSASGVVLVADRDHLSLQVPCQAIPGEAMVASSRHTVIVDRQGRIAAKLGGNEYTAKQLGDLTEAVMARR